MAEAVRAKCIQQLVAIYICPFSDSEIFEEQKLSTLFGIKVAFTA